MNHLENKNPNNINKKEENKKIIKNKRINKFKPTLEIIKNKRSPSAKIENIKFGIEIEKKNLYLSEFLPSKAIHKK